jgi:DNA polymerase-3 subunit epsilon
MIIERVIILDIETTGLSVPRGDRVIELGAVAVEDGCIVDEIASLIDSGASINYPAFRVHGISAEMLVGKPTSREIWPLFREFVGEAPLVAHNAPFDSGFVRSELSRLGLPLVNNWHCTVKLARKKLPQLPNHRLETVYRYLFGEIPCAVQRHRALDDARLAARVWVELT